MYNYCGATEQMRACASRYDESAWTSNDEARIDANIASTGVRCIFPHKKMFCQVRADKIFLNKRYKNTPKNKQEKTTDIRRILLYLPYLGETSLQLEKELRNFFRKYLKELAHLCLIHKTHAIGDHFKYKDKQAHLERCNVVYKLKYSCGHSYIGQTQRNLKFRLDEHNPLKSNHQATDAVKHSYTYPGHFTGLNAEIMASALNYRELLIKETLLIQEQQPEINVDNFSTPLYLFST